MASSTKNVKLGVCKVYLGGQDLGFTQGGVEVMVTTDTHVVNVDQFGKSTVNELIMARNVKVKCPLVETTVRNIVATMPGSTLFTDGALAASSLTFTTPVAATTFTIGGQVFTFTATTTARPTTAFMVQLASTPAQSVQNAMDTINRALVISTASGTVLNNAAGGITASINPLTPLVISLVAGDPGVAGNSVTIAPVTATLGVVGVAGGSFIGGVAETKVRIESTTGVGQDLLSIAKVLRLHPTNKADTDFSDDFVVYQAATAGALTFAYKVDAERVFNIEFNGYPDDKNRLFAVGDLNA